MCNTKLSPTDVISLPLRGLRIANMQDFFPVLYVTQSQDPLSGL